MRKNGTRFLKQEYKYCLEAVIAFKDPVKILTNRMPNDKSDASYCFYYFKFNDNQLT